MRYSKHKLITLTSKVFEIPCKNLRFKESIKIINVSFGQYFNDKVKNYYEIKEICVFLEGWFISNNLVENQVKSVISKKDKISKFYKSNDFLKSWEWTNLRYMALKKYGRVCMCCGSKEKICVDHIKPRSKYPELALDFNNLQILCYLCNKGKSNTDETDWRINI